MKKVEQNIKKFFSDLRFNEEKHQYSVGEKRLQGSVSSMVSKYYEKFNADEQAYYTGLSAGKTKEEVLVEWAFINREAIERGNRVHKFGELYQTDRSLKPSCPQEEAVVKFWNTLPEYLEPVTAELMMYHKELFFAGTMDILLYDRRDKTYVIADYKTNKDLRKNYKKKCMLYPFNSFLDSPLNHYQLQLSYYQILVEQIPGVKVSNRVIVHLNLEGEFDIISTEDVTPILKQQLGC